MSDRKTAAEFLAELAADPAFQETRKAQEAEIAKRKLDMGLAERLLVQDLQAIGVAVSSVWDLVNTQSLYPEAVPVLLAHLRRSNHPRVKEGIIRALAVPYAMQAWDDLLAIFQAEPSGRTGGLKSVAGIALGVIADDSVIDDVVGIAADPANGMERVALIGALQRSSDPRAGAALELLRGDPKIGREMKRLRRLKVHKNRE